MLNILSKTTLSHRLNLKNKSIMKLIKSTTLLSRLDWGLIAVLILSLFTAIPLLSNVGLPNGSDVLYHTYRVGEMHRSWQHGVLFPSWAEGLYFGYGSPLFHFYASLTYYLTSILTTIFNASALDALRTVLMVSLLGCSSGMYLFVKRRAGRLGGIIAGLVYVYSPYLMYTETYARGTYPELLAFALFPFILWRIDALRDKPAPLNFIWVVLLEVALINAHNLMALTLTMLILGWILWESVIQKSNHHTSRLRWQPSAFAFLAVILGLAVSAGFWLPVLLESESVNLQNLTGVALLDYRNFFVPLGDLLAMTPRHDAGAINGLSELLILGVAQWGLALIAIIMTLWMYSRGYRTRHAQAYLGMLFFVLMALVLITMMTPFAAGFWESFRSVQLLQFPWRLLGPVVACLAIIAGMNGLWLERLTRPLQIGLVAVIVALPIMTVIPLFYVPEWSNTDVDTSSVAYHASEKAGLQMGTTFTDEYRPSDAFTIPAPTDDLLADYADDYPIDKFNRTMLPENAELKLIYNAPQSHEWHIRTDEPFTAEIYNFYWLGWQAEIDGQPIDITPSLHHGLITIFIPAGEHTIKVYLGSTPARDLGRVISWVSIVIVMIVAVWMRRLQPISQPDRTATSLSQTAIIGIVLGGIIALLSVFVLYREGVGWLNSSAGEALPATIHETFTLDDSLKVLGYDINAQTFRAGDRLIVRVYWYAVEEMDINFSSFLHVSTGGPPVAQIDKLHPGGRAISEWWSPEGYIIDTYDLYLPETLSAGEYQLYIGLYTCELMPANDCGNGYRPTIVNADSQIVGDTVPLGMIQVE
jgi:hypothetical protein